MSSLALRPKSRSSIKGVERLSLLSSDTRRGEEGSGGRRESTFQVSVGRSKRRLDVVFIGVIGDGLRECECEGEGLGDGVRLGFRREWLMSGVGVP